jgi:hypothetical protein
MISSAFPGDITMTKILRISVAGDWQASEFSEMFDSVSEVYRIFSLVDLWGKFLDEEVETMERRDDWPLWLSLPSEILANPKFDERVDAIMRSRSYSQIVVTGLEFHSPGYADFLGFGKVIEHICGMTQFAVDRWLRRDDRKLEREEKSIRNERLRLENEQLAIKNMEALMKLKERYKLPDAEVDSLSRRLERPQGKILRLVHDNKIVGADVVNKAAA